MSVVQMFQSYVLSNFGRAGKHDEATKLAIAGLGMGGEAGEVQELVKKHIRDGRPLVGNEDLKLELGDALHYLTYLAGRAGFTLEDVMLANMEKLDIRYGNKPHA